jgi:DamX protein
MVEDDTFTYQAKRQPAEPTTAGSTSTLDYALITKERTQKLDLLLHLLANLPHSLVVCGPEGIGKTTLLTVLQERRTEVWQYCLMQGDVNLSFEAIQRHLAQAISREQALAITLARYQEQHKQLILIIDNAGALVPGLIAAVIQYAIANPALKVIFALTHDELQVKRGTDRAVDDCHIVEIPTLSEKQCGDFLQHLSLKPAANLTFKAINDNMIAHVYRETHGVPGRIIEAVSDLSGAKRGGGKLTWQLPLAVAAAIGIAVGAQWLLLSKDTDKADVKVEQVADELEIIPPAPPTLPPAQASIEAPEQVLPEQTVAPIETTNPKDNHPAFVSEVKTLLESAAVTKAPLPTETKEIPEQPLKPAAIELPSVEKQKVKTVPKPETKPALKPEIKPEPKPKPKPEPTAEQVEHKPDTGTPPKTAEQLWAAQEKLRQEMQAKGHDPKPLAELLPPTEPASIAPTKHFTLQLIVLSKQASVNNIVKKYPAMEPDIKTIKTLIKGQERFVLYYGAYPDAASANRAKQSLPFEFRNALVKKE